MLLFQSNVIYMHNQLRNAQTTLGDKTFCLYPLPQLQAACLLGGSAECQRRDIAFHLAFHTGFLLH